MKKILIATAAMAALAATTAQAQAPATENWTVEAFVEARCAINTDSNTVVDISGTDMANENGRLRENAVQNALLNGFNAKDTRAWCSGANNGVRLQRTALVHTNPGDLNGFAGAVLFDLGIDIEDVIANPAYTYDEGTSDGASGPGNVNRFGPLGQGARVQFV